MKKKKISMAFTENKTITLLASSLLIHATHIQAQDTGQNLEEVVVIGVKASQERSINNKKFADSVLDSISAEDIGKLPDVTIADSLQRITGVQIRRSAGEGSQISVRGMKQVHTQLNGEAFLSAGSVTNNQPDFSDIPSQLFKGADVNKSPTTSSLSSGITGLINLKTTRPFDLDEGFTLTGAAEGQYGEDTKQYDPSINLFTGWRNENTGIVLSVAYQNKVLGNSYNGVQGGDGYGGWYQSVNEDGRDINLDGDQDDIFIGFQGHTAYNSVNERERIGVNLSLQHYLGEGFTLTSDIFYTDMEDIGSTAGLAFSEKWQTMEWAQIPEYRNTGVNNINTAQVYDATGRRLKSFSSISVKKKESTNINLELNYDNAGQFKFNTRAIIAKADNNELNSYADIDMADGSQWGVKYQNYPNGRRATNPGGYSGFQNITIDYRGDNPRWSNVPSAIVGDLNSYAIGALSSENNKEQEGDLTIFRFDGDYALESGFITNIKSGLRFSSRKTTNNEFHLLAPFGDNNCLVRWKATDVTLNKPSCSWGKNLDDTDKDNNIYYTAGTPKPLASFHNDVIRLSDFGSVTGIPAIYTLDPKAMKDVLAFHNSQYPGNVKATIPGRSYQAGLDELTIYLQNDFATEIAGFALIGNIGARYIQTDLNITQNIVGSAQPYGAPEGDNGDQVITRSYSDFLPALNTTLELSENMLVRFAYTENMAPLDLVKWAGGLTPGYALNADTGIFEIHNATADGNPELNPWRSTNYDLSWEYYFGSTSMVNIALFKINVDSFVAAGTVAMQLPDQDGVVRRTTNVDTSIQGKGGSLEGIELGIKQSFDDIEMLAGILSGFGFEANYTYSPSDSGFKDVNGDDLAFSDNSEHQANVIGWYQNNKLQVRLAYNYRSERVVSFNQAGIEGLTLFQNATAFLDASINYDVTDNINVFLSASNLTGEFEKYYLQWEDQPAWQNIYEKRYTLGIRGRF